MTERKDETVVDAELATLPAARDPAVVRRHLQSIVGNPVAEDGAITHVHTEIVRQRLKRCVLLYTLNFERSAPRKLYGKIFRAGEGQPIYARMCALWECGFDLDAEDGIRIPAPLAFVPELELLVQEAVPGRSFKEHLVERGSPAQIGQVARALAKLHSLADWPGPLFRLERHLGRCHPPHGRLCEALPERAADVEAIVREARARESQYPDTVLAATHGDLHLSQILLDAAATYLIDLDSLARGDPAADLANFLVFLRSNRRVQGLDRLEKVFLEEYFSRMDPDIAKRVPVYEALTQVRRACKDLRFGRPGWEARASQRITRGVECLELRGR